MKKKNKERTIQKDKGNRQREMKVRKKAKT